MPVKIKCFGGKIGWAAQKIFPKQSSAIITKLNFARKRKNALDYIEAFQNEPTQPQQIAIETVNRCNNICGFCPCNINDENRPFKKMPEDLFQNIVSQLISWKYNGRILMNINNEPFIDTRFNDMVKYLRGKMPENYIFVITNGTLLTLEKFIDIAPHMNRIHINNYANTMKLHENASQIYKHVSDNPVLFNHLDLTIQLRYLGEVISNRNGNAPNKPISKSVINEPCIEPYYSMCIYPDGVVGLCCTDVLEKTNLGNCGASKLSDIWHSHEFVKIRELMQKSRSGYGHCKYCDVYT